MINRSTTLALAAAAVGIGLTGTALAADPAPKAKNVILMISDGQGFNAMKAADLYTGAPSVYQGSGFVRFGMQTSSANNPAGYDPAGMAGNFAYSKTGATDSASAASAMYGGVKIRDNDINWTVDDKPIESFFETAARAGRSIGAVSSVEFTHATPAAVFGHNNSRNNYSEMALEAVNGSNPVANNAFHDALNYNGNLKVVMGTGHPNYNADGVDVTTDGNSNTNPDYRYVGGSEAWTNLGNGHNGWTLVQDKAAFEALVAGTTPGKVFGVAPNISTLQQGRTAGAALLTNQPTLVTMTKAALNVLDNSPSGFAVMIEGGAVDWAGHANQKDRIIEEQVDFNNSVQAVVDYLNAGTGGNDWSNTLLIVTADHETGHLWGDDDPSSYFDVNQNGQFDAGVDYAHLDDNGAGNLPGMTFNSGSHTNQLVPLFARGPGAELFASKVIGTDANLRGIYNLDSSWTGQYIDNTAIYYVMKEATAVPEPAMLSVMGVGTLALRRRRR